LKWANGRFGPFQFLPQIRIDETYPDLQIVKRESTAQELYVRRVSSAACAGTTAKEHPYDYRYRRSRSLDAQLVCR